MLNKDMPAVSWEKDADNPSDIILPYAGYVEQLGANDLDPFTVK